MQTTYDIAVLGGGPAGYVAAIRAAQLGANVALIEKDELGGVCMNVGCIPTKALIKSAEVYQSAKNGKEFGVECENIKTNWQSAVLRKERIIKMLGKGISHLMDTNKITLIKGEGEIISSSEISVRTAENEENTNVKFNKLIIATGSRPLVPTFIKGCEQQGVLTSTDALSLNEIPSSIAIIGGGVIGIEFATLFAEMGAKVTVLELESHILPQEDNEISLQLERSLKRKGIKFELGAKAEEILNIDSQTQENLCVKYTHSGQEKTLAVQNVLIALGRTYNSEIAQSLNLKTEKGYIAVDEYMQTSHENIYAAGDIVGGKLLAHLAYAQGRAAAENAMGIKSNVNYNAVPSCVYTTPEIASVGINESEATAQGINAKIGRFDFRVNGRALTLGERDGFVKIVADENGVILGGQILGANASEMITELSLAVALKLTAEQIADIIHPHPAMCEAIWEACCEIAGKALHK